MKNYTLLLAFIISHLSWQINAQDYLLNNALNGQTVNTCSGTFYDSGGAGGNHGTGEDYVVTFCSDGSSGSHIVFDFTMFDVSAGTLGVGASNLLIYDGPDVNSPQLGTYNNDFSIEGTIVRATEANASGCLTFRFVSAGGFLAQTANGWAAGISCSFPCQTVNAGLASSTPVDDNGFINICPGEEVTFNGEGIYPQSGSNYNQDDASSEFEWRFGGGQIASGQTVSHTFSEAGGYRIRLEVTDNNGCISSNNIGIFVQVANPPNFNGTNASDYTICFDETTTLTGVASPSEWVEDPPEPILDTIFLPDGTGVCYEPQIEYEIFQPGATLDDMNDLIDVWAILEHSYLGDLDISIICPNGQSVHLHNQGQIFLSGLSGNLGEPALFGNDPGVGYEYSWPVENPDNGTFQQEGAGGTNLPAGSFTSEQDLSGLLGCPLNGVWKLKICDNQTQDDGYSFGFGLNFNPNLFEWRFEPTIETETWLAGPELTPTGANTATVGPFPNNTDETINYTYSITDDFGCTHDTTIAITVLPSTHPDCAVDGCLLSMTTEIVNCRTTPTLAYDVEGEITFSEPPSTGQLIVQNCFGQQVTFDAPFTSPLTFSFDDLPQTGDDCEFTAYFTADQACEATSSVTAPSPITFFNVECVIGGGELEGTIEFENPPAGANLVISVSDGTNTIQDVISMPAGSPQTWSVTGLDPAASPYVIDYYFDNFPDCGQQMTINCGCAADAGTTTTNMTGDSQTNYELCFGDQITIDLNGDHEFPDDEGDLGGFPYAPEMAFLVYSCPPTPGMFPNDDPCFITIIDQTGSLTDENGTTSILNQLGGEANLGTNTLYFTPVTLYHYTPGGPFILNANCWDIGTVTEVTYSPQLIASASGDELQCGETGAIVSGAAIGGTPPYLFDWDGEPKTEPEHSVDPEITANYTVNVIDANGCSDNASATVVVLPGSAVVAGPDQEVCEGEEITLTATGASTYQWDNDAPHETAFIPPVGTTIYTVTGTDANGCQSTDNLTVTVLPNPNINAGPDQEICQGESVTLTATGGVQYVWDNNVTNGAAFTPNQTQTYTVVGATAQGCINMDQVTVTVHPNPTVSAGNDFLVCDGETAILTGSGASTYTWDNGVQNGVPFLPTQTTTYTVTGTSIHGCTGTDQVDIIVSPIPQITIDGENLSGCAPLTPILSNTTATAGTNCVWTFSNDVVLSGCQAVSHTFEAPGCYDVNLTVTTNDGCTNNQTLTDYICVFPDPVADFYNEPTNLSSLNSATSFVNMSTGAVEYYWDFGTGNHFSNEENPDFIFPNKVDNYTVTLTASSEHGCIDQVSKIIPVKEDLIFYVPNAFTPDGDDYNETFFPVFTEGFDPMSYHLTIFNRWGEVLFESFDSNHGWDGTYGGNIVKDGTYIWTISFKKTDVDDREEHVGHVTLLK